MKKPLLIAIVLFLFLSNSIAQDWRFFSSSKEMRSSGITNLFGNRFLSERIRDIHSFEGKTFGSTLFIDVNSSSKFQDKVVFMPNQFMLIIFEKKDFQYWIIVKAVSKKWSKVISEVVEKNSDIPIYSDPLRPLNNPEKVALRNIVDRVKQIYCPVEDDIDDILFSELNEFFGEEELDAAYNEVRRKYIDAKNKYLKAVEKYNKEKSVYEKEMKKYEEEYESWKEEHEKYLEKKEAYEELVRQIEAEGVKWEELKKQVRGAESASNLMIIYDWEYDKIFFVDQEKGFVVYEEKIYNEILEEKAKEIYYKSGGLYNKTETRIGLLEGLNITGVEYLRVPGEWEIRRVYRDYPISENVRNHYGIKKAFEGELPDEPEAPKDFDKELPDEPEEVTEVDPDEPALSEYPKIYIEPLSDEIYEQGVISCPANLKRGGFDFGIKNQEVNTYLIDAPNSSDVNDWLLLTAGYCYKCGGWQKSLEAEVFAPMFSTSVRIKRTIPFGVLASPEPSEQRDWVLSNIYRAFKLAQEGKIKNNVVKYLGQEGFTYETIENDLALNFKNQEVVFKKGTELDLVSLKEWYRIFYKEEIPPLYADIYQVKIFFETIAEGKSHWSNLYRQNPLAFLAKYCTVNTTQ
jgi:hypothetical protein